MHTMTVFGLSIANAAGDISPQWAIIIAAFFAGVASVITAWIGPRRYREEITTMKAKIEQQTALIERVISENVALRIENARNQGYEQVFVSIIEQQNNTITNLWTENQGYRIKLGIQVDEDEKPPIMAPPIAPASNPIPSTLVDSVTRPQKRKKTKETPDGNH